MRDDLEWHVVDVLLDLWVLVFTTDQPVAESRQRQRKRFEKRMKKVEGKRGRKKKKKKGKTPRHTHLLVANKVFSGLTTA
jgi:hypothetical protein